MIETGHRQPANLFMLGLDAASLPFIRDHADRLPFLATLLAEGTVTALRTPATYLSASVWPTFYAGCPPGVHRDPRGPPGPDGQLVRPRQR